MTSRGERTLTARGLVVVEAYMLSRGLDFQRAVREFGIDPAIARDPEGRVPLRSVLLLHEALARDTCDEAFNVKVGERFQFGNLGTLDYVIANAPTLRSAIADYIRFLHLISDGVESQFEELPGVSFITAHIPPAFGVRTQYMDLLTAARVVRIRHIVRDPDLPIHVDMERRAPKAIAEFYRILGPHVRFGQPENRIGVPTSALSRPLAAADPQLYDVLVLAAQSALAHARQASDGMQGLRSHIGMALSHGEVRFETVAEALGMSERQLERELERSRTTFRDLMRETRKSMANYYVRETELPLTEIAFLLGFSELSAFSRAARAWFGASPRDIRKQVMRGGSG